MIVLGLDPSLTATGYAWAPGRTGVLSPGSARGLVRIQWHRDAVGSLIAHCRANDRLRLVVYEGPSYDSQDVRGFHERAGLWWALLAELDSLGVPVAIAPPSNVKLMALGKGGGAGTGKTEVTIAARDRLGYTGSENNEADALWLAALGYQRLGVPLARVPATHLRALDGVAWPPGV